MVTQIRSVADNNIFQSYSQGKTDALHTVSSTESGILTRICYEEFGIKLSKLGHDLCYKESQIQEMDSHVGNPEHGRVCYCKLWFCTGI